MPLVVNHNIPRNVGNQDSLTSGTHLIAFADDGALPDHWRVVSLALGLEVFFFGDLDGCGNNHWYDVWQ